MQSESPITKLTSATLDSLLRQQPLFNSSEVTLDLTQIKFVSPGALVPLAAFCHALQQNKCKTTIQLSDNDVRTYLLRSGFTSVIQDIVTFQPNIPKARSRFFEELRGTNPLLIEVTKIENGAALPELLNQIVHVLRFRLKYKNMMPLILQQVFQKSARTLLTIMTRPVASSQCKPISKTADDLLKLPLLITEQV